MKIRLDKIGVEPQRWRETLSIPAAQLNRTQLLELHPVSWSGQIWSDHPGYRLAAEFSYEQVVACDRCLSPINQDVDGDLQLILMTNAPQPTEEEIELAAEDLEILYLDGDEIDPESLLIEQLQLSVPMRAICREDCQGLCPDCGSNRNLEQCGCEEARIDPRWEALRGLKSDS